MAEVAAFEKQTERSESWPLGCDFRKDLHALGELLLPGYWGPSGVEGPRFVCPDAVRHRATASGKRVAAAVATILVRLDVDYAQRKVVSKLQAR
jgi:hypothetical protein